MEGERVLELEGVLRSGDASFYMGECVDVSVSLTPEVAARMSESWGKGIAGSRVRVTIEVLDG